MLIDTNQVVTKTDLRINLAEILAAVKGGEEKIISERGKIIAKMSPMSKKTKKNKLIKEYEQLRKSLSKYTSDIDSTQFVRQMRDSRK